MINQEDTDDENACLHGFLQATMKQNINKMAEWLQTPPESIIVRSNKDMLTESILLDLIFKYSKKNDVSVSKVFPGCFSLKRKPNPINLFHKVSEYKIVYIDTRCAESVARGSDVYIPGVKSIIQPFKESDMLLLRIHGMKNFEAIGKARESSDYILQNSHGLAVEALSVMINGRLITTPPSIGNLPSYIISQSYGSLLVGFNTLSYILSLKRKRENEHSNNEEVKIIEFCSAPGNKTTHLALLLEQHKIKSKLYSCEKSSNRFQRLKLNCDKYLSNLEFVQVFPLNIDSTTFIKKETNNRLTPKLARKFRYEAQKHSKDVYQARLSELYNSESRVTSETHKQLIENLKSKRSVCEFIAYNDRLEEYQASMIAINQVTKIDFSTEKFDIVLVDAPCTCSGLRPRLDLHTLHLSKLKYMKRVQLDLLESALKKVATDGIIIYSTCSVLEKENTAVIETFLEKYDNVSLISMPLSERGIKQKYYVHDINSDVDASGFFIATILKS